MQTETYMHFEQEHTNARNTHAHATKHNRWKRVASSCAHTENQTTYAKVHSHEQQTNKHTRTTTTCKRLGNHAKIKHEGVHNKTGTCQNMQTHANTNAHTAHIQKHKHNKQTTLKHQKHHEDTYKTHARTLQTKRR